MSDMSNLKGYDEWAAHLYLNTLKGKKEIGWPYDQPVPIERTREFIAEGVRNGNGKQIIREPEIIFPEGGEDMWAMGDGWGNDDGDDGLTAVDESEVYSDGHVTININIYQRGAE